MKNLQCRYDNGVLTIQPQMVVNNVAWYIQNYRDEWNLHRVGETDYPGRSSQHKTFRQAYRAAKKLEEGVK